MYQTTPTTLHNLQLATVSKIRNQELETEKLII